MLACLIIAARSRFLFPGRNARGTSAVHTALDTSDLNLLYCDGFETVFLVGQLSLFQCLRLIVAERRGVQMEAVLKGTPVILLRLLPMNRASGGVWPQCIVKDFLRCS